MFSLRGIGATTVSQDVGTYLSSMFSPTATQCENTWNPITGLTCLVNGTALADVYSSIEYNGVAPLPVNGTVQPLTQAQIDSMTPAEIQNALAQSQIQNTADLTDTAIQNAINNGYNPSGVPGWVWIVGGAAALIFGTELLGSGGRRR